MKNSREIIEIDILSTNITEVVALLDIQYL